MFQRAFVAGVSAALLALLLSSPAQATQENRNQDRSDERDGPSRNEAGRLSYIPLETEGGGRARINRIVIIQTRFLYVAETSGTPDGFGVDFESLDKLDTSSVPLIGALFGSSVSADDFTEENRVGNVYIAGDNTLATVVDDSVNVGGLKLSVVNGDGRYQLLVEPQIIEVPPNDLGDFGKLGIVRELMTQTATVDNTVVLTGLTKSTVPEVESKVPWLGDVPILQGLFKGRSYRKEETELLLFVTPSILVDEES